MDFASAREWLDMADINATALARELINKGRADAAIISALTVQGVSRPTARKCLERARKVPKTRPYAAIGPVESTRVTVRLAQESVDALREAAAKRGVSLHLLTSKIVAIVVEDEMINAVLDDQT
jgi:hypothetical protein